MLTKPLYVIVLALVLIITGCQKGSISDPYTMKEIDLVEPSANNIIIEIVNDSMLGASAYSAKKLVVDPDYYVRNEFKRGDIVYFSYPEDIIKQRNLTHTNEEMQILRVVGLSEERISMKKGQIYINGKQLDAFCGYDTNNNLKELKKRLKESDLENFEIDNIKNSIHFVENENMDEIHIPKESIFLIGDNRAQALDSTIIGPVLKAAVIGKLLGESK